MSQKIQTTTQQVLQAQEDDVGGRFCTDTKTFRNRIVDLDLDAYNWSPSGFAVFYYSDRYFAAGRNS
jgi:hypothetical protein